MSKERELLQRILDYMWEGELADEIKELLAQPEQEAVEDRIARWHKLGFEQGKKASQREPLTPQQISEGNQSMLNATRESFIKGNTYLKERGSNLMTIQQDDIHISNASISDFYDSEVNTVFLKGDSAETLKTVPDGSVKLIITSPPYNLNKVYEDIKSLDDYFEQMEPVIQEMMRVLSPEGSLCWQVGNYVAKGEVFPLDMYYYPYFKKHGLKLRNRVIWHFDHGLHASKRLSGRYETLLWFTKGDNYTFNLDPIRVPSKYPGKRNYKPGKNYGQPSGNPLGKNPSDIWKILERDWERLLWDIPNVKANHPEKTIHPCQFPIELVERCVLAFTNEGDWVLDPFSGVGSAMLAALKQGRKTIGCEKEDQYIALAKDRVNQFNSGVLPYRQMGKPVHKPTGKEKVSQRPAEWDTLVKDIG